MSRNNGNYRKAQKLSGKRYPEEFKLAAVRQIIEGGYTTASGLLADTVALQGVGCLTDIT